MTNKNLRIKFKVTAGRKFKCKKCKKELYGEDGFIEIRDADAWGYTFKRICWNCFTEFLKGTEEDREYRKANFQELVKRNIVRHL